MNRYFTALSLLTVVPPPTDRLPTEAEIAQSRHCFPAVGVFLGLILGGLAALFGNSNSTTVGAFMVLLTWVGITGALHLDGLADTCDGLFGGNEPESRLRIMKDPQVGTFGLLGLILALLGKFAALLVLVAWSSGPLLIGAAAIVARCLVLFLAAGSRYPRSEGTGKVLIEATPLIEGRIYILVTAVVIALATPQTDLGSFTVLFLPALGVAICLKWLCNDRLKGVTGDCLGAGIEMMETVVLLSAALLAV